MEKKLPVKMAPVASLLLSSCNCSKYFCLLLLFALLPLLFSCGKEEVANREFIQRSQSPQLVDDQVLLAPEDLPEDITFWSDYPSQVLARALVQRMSDS